MIEIVLYKKAQPIPSNHQPSVRDTTLSASKLGNGKPFIPD